VIIDLLHKKCGVYPLFNFYEAIMESVLYAIGGENKVPGLFGLFGLRAAAVQTKPEAPL
jgi:hypothetical protein